MSKETGATPLRTSARAHLRSRPFRILHRLIHHGKWCVLLVFFFGGEGIVATSLGKMKLHVTFWSYTLVCLLDCVVLSETVASRAIQNGASLLSQPGPTCKFDDTCVKEKKKRERPAKDYSLFFKQR